MSSFDWQKQQGLLWEAATKDVQQKAVDDKSTTLYVERIQTKFEAFFDSNILADRELFMERIDKAITSKGKFSLVLGGVSVGKTVVLKQAVERFNRGGEVLILYVDGRSYPNKLSQGLAHSLAKLKSIQYLQNRLAGDTWERALVALDTLDTASSKSFLVTKAKATIQQAMEEAAVDDETQNSVSKLLDDLADSYEFAITAEDGKQLPSGDGTVADFMQFARDQNKHPVIVIDEANAVMNVDVDNKAGVSEEEMKDLLMLFVKHTKQDKELNVILATSDYSYPFQLKRAMNTNHISRIIVATELSPRNTWKLLVDQTYPSSNARVTSTGGEPIIGMGPHLATLLISAYGGHLLSMMNAINSLEEGASFRISQGFPLMFTEIDACLQVPGTKKLLSQMAEFGFAPIVKASDMAAAEQIEKNNLGGLVGQNAALTGLPSEMWSDASTKKLHQAGLLPSSQTMRLVIGNHLKDLKKARGFWGRVLFWRSK